jgi:hypothetical protein
MCQQWLSVLGLILDVVGVLMIVSEWHIMFRRHIAQSIVEIDALYARLRNELTPPHEEEPHWSMGRHMLMGLAEDVRYRGRLVYWGAGILVLGFVLQALGALPGGIPGTAVSSCSKFGFAP